MAKNKKEEQYGSATLKDVADYIGMSTATVSLVVNQGKGHERISDSTKKLVQNACRELHYNPNFFAQGLRKKATRQILLAIPDFYNPFSPPLIQGVKNVLSSVGYNAIIMDIEGLVDKANLKIRDAALLEPLTRLIHGGVDGIITHVSWTVFSSIVSSNLPIVHIDEDPAISPGVGFDAERAAYIITKLFTEQGCTKIAYIGANQDSYSFRVRENGYKRALLESGIPPRDDLIMRVEASPDGAEIAFRWLLQQPTLPEAICIYTDIVAHALQLKLLGAGIKIPEQVAIASIDDTAQSKMMVPPLSSVYVPAFELGQRAARIVLRMLEGEVLKDYYELAEICLNERESSQFVKRSGKAEA